MPRITNPKGIAINNRGFIYLLRAITAFRVNVTTLGKDCCPIVNSFEKNYRDKKT